MKSAVIHTLLMLIIAVSSAIGGVGVDNDIRNDLQRLKEAIILRTFYFKPSDYPIKYPKELELQIPGKSINLLMIHSRGYFCDPIQIAIKSRIRFDFKWRHQFDSQLRKDQGWTLLNIPRFLKIMYIPKVSVRHGLYVHSELHSQGNKTIPLDHNDPLDSGSEFRFCIEHSANQVVVRVQSDEMKGKERNLRLHSKNGKYNSDDIIDTTLRLYYAPATIYNLQIGWKSTTDENAKDKTHNDINDILHLYKYTL